MKKRHWRDVFWFVLGTFFGGFVLRMFLGLFTNFKKDL